jgi:hypothetical protein
MRSIEREPGAPVPHAARPAQIQAAQRKPHQAERQRAADHLARIARQQQEAVQLFDPFKEILARQFRQQRAGVGIEINRFALALARRRRKTDARTGTRRVVQHDAGDALVRLGRFRRQHDLLRPQHRRALHGDVAHAGIERVENLLAERERGAGQADHHQDRAGRDADKPMQLEPELLHRSTFTLSLIKRGAPDAGVPAPAQ